LFAIFVSTLGCAHRDPSAPAWKARVIRPRQDAAPSGQRASAPPKVFSGPDAWFHREIAEREARIEALRQQVERAEGREDEQAEDVKGRLERELELEEQSLHDFREASTKRYSPGMTAGGLTLVGVGALSLLITGYVAFVAWGPYNEFSDRQRRDATVAVAVLLTHVVGGFAVGFPLHRVGNRRFPKPGPTARLWVGPGEASVRGSF
jgi:hypothetical protein